MSHELLDIPDANTWVSCNASLLCAISSWQFDVFVSPRLTAVTRKDEEGPAARIAIIASEGVMMFSPSVGVNFEPQAFQTDQCGSCLTDIDESAHGLVESERCIFIAQQRNIATKLQGFVTTFFPHPLYASFSVSGLREKPSCARDRSTEGAKE